mgnify:FL=1|jgi:hypothetical protein|tara:strand:+ start:243 stop:449 length:207 start_codon:yes stop_codon:yes gene_type:complete
MDEDNLNLEIRKFLKQVGISSQREIENYIRKKFSERSIKTGESIKVSMNLSSEDGELNHSIKEDIKIK